MVSQRSRTHPRLSALGVSEQQTPSTPPVEPFEDYLERIVHQWTKTITVLGFTLVPLFLILDYFTMPAELLQRFFAYRVVTTALVMAQFFLIRASKPARHSYLHGYLFTFVVGYMIARMTSDLGGFDSAYYAGLNLVLVAVNVLLPWKPVHSLLNGLMVVGMYLVINLASGQSYNNLTLINNLYFLCATVVIAVAINHTKHQLVKEEFHLRAELLTTNLRLDSSRVELKRARDALWGEMEIAKRIQTALLPSNRTVGNYEISATMNPAEEVGGDYYDIIDNGASERWVAIGDVSGHGVESGLVMMMTQTSIASLVSTPGLQPSAVFATANAVLKDNIARLGGRRYMTLNIIRLLPDGLVVAGQHQDILIWRAATGQVETVLTEGCWLGLVDDTRPFNKDRTIPLAVHDVVFLFTDGVTEASHISGELYGQDRLVAALKRAGGKPLNEAMDLILAEVKLFQAAQDDDITMMMLRRTS